MGTTNSVSLSTFVRSPTAWIELVDLRRGSAPFTHRNRPIGRLVPPDMTLALLQGYQVSVGQLQANLAWISHEVRKGQRFTVLQHGRRVLDIVPDAGRRPPNAADPARALIGFTELDDAATFIGDGQAGTPLASLHDPERDQGVPASLGAAADTVFYWDRASTRWVLTTFDEPGFRQTLALDASNARVARLCDLRIAQRALPEQAANIAGAYLRAVDGAWSLLVIINGGQGVVGVPVRSSGDDGLAGVPCDPEHVPHARAAILRDLFGTKEGQ